MPKPHEVVNAIPMRFSAVSLRHMCVRLARTIFQSRSLTAALVLIMVTASLSIAQAWARQRPVMASSLTEPKAPAFSTWQATTATDETISCGPSTNTPPPAGAQWDEAWRLTTDTTQDMQISFPHVSRCGKYFVVQSATYNSPSILKGYVLENGHLKELWKAPPKIIHTWGSNPWWGGHMLLKHEILNPATGTIEKAPWSTNDYPYIMSPDLVLTCNMYGHTNHCAAWEWNNGAPKQRWERQYDKQVEPVAFGVAGDTSAPSPLVELSQPKGNGWESVGTGIMNLSDGTVTALPDELFPGERADYIPARDGWIRIPKKSGTAETYSLQGEHIGSFPLSGSNAPLLISESGIPTLEQFQKAYESGDTSWAKYVVECTTKDACTFNGTPVTLPFERSFVYPPGRGELQIHWNLSNDQQVLAVSVHTIGGVDSELNDKTSLVIDTQTARVITPPTSSSHIITSLGDSGLLVGIQGAEIVGYTPNHS